MVVRLSKLLAVIIHGDKGTIVDMNELGVWDALFVKEQTLKTAIVCIDCYIVATY